MANRHLQRSIAMQSLFEWDFQGGNNDNIDDIIDRNVKEFAPGIDQYDFVTSLVKGTMQNLSDIDAIIEKCAPEWPLDRCYNRSQCFTFGYL